jgi:hypothetical protein
MFGDPVPRSVRKRQRSPRGSVRAGAFWLLLGPDVQFRRTDYDVAGAAERLRQSGMPEIDEMLPDSLLAPVPRDEVAAFFERQAGRSSTQL